MIQNTRSSSLLSLSKKSHLSLSQAEPILENGPDNANTKREIRESSVKLDTLEDAALFASETMVRRVMPRPELKTISRSTASERCLIESILDYPLTSFIIN